jgi:hypothetical protein
MRFSWHKTTLFGIALSIPAIRFLIQKTEEQITAFSKHSAEIAACDKCHKLFNHHRSVAWIQHMCDFHGFNQDTAIYIVSDLCKKLWILKWRDTVPGGGSAGK